MASYFKSPKLIGLAALALCLLALLIWRDHSCPRVIIHLDTIPSHCDLWLGGQHMGTTPLDIDVTDRLLENAEPASAGKTFCVVNAIYGKENLLELDCFLGLWKVGRLRLEAGQGGGKDEVQFIGPAPVPQQKGWGRYEVGLIFRVGSWAE